MAKEIYVDQGECTACGLRVDELPEVFQFNHEGLSEVHNPGGADEKAIEDVIDICPAICNTENRYQCKHGASWYLLRIKGHTYSITVITKGASCLINRGSPNI